MNERVWLSCLLLLACRPNVPIGTDDAVIVDMDCVSVPATVSCPAPGSWGRISTPSSSAELRARLLGQWAFCGGERRSTGRGTLSGFYGGAGVEFWEENGTLRYSFLEGTGPYRRRAAGFNEGTVRLELSATQVQAVLVAADGLEASWKVELFDGQRVMRNSAFDVWNFVAVTPP